MFIAIGKLLRWIFEKFASAGLIVSLAVLACALWLFLKDNVDFEQWQRDLVRTITGERAKTQAALDDVKKELAGMSAEIVAEQERGKKADAVMEQLRDLESTWQKMFGNSAQQKANAEQLVRMGEIRKASTRKIAEIQERYSRKVWERDGLELALGKVDQRLAAAQEKESRTMHYLTLAWEKAQFWVIGSLLLYFFGPTAGKLTLFYSIAPMIARGRPVRLEQELAAMPDVGPSAVSAELVLQPGEHLRVKGKFLQASDEGMAKTTRWLLDWRMPFTCVAAGLTELVELSRPKHQGERRLTLTHHEPNGELSVITLGEGAALILRPSFLVGVVTAEGQRLSIRRRWQLFRWQSWVTLQFRFFEFSGPCRLIIVGQRGVRAERLDQREGKELPARRTNQDATIGFTPNLDYGPVRAETFWSYYRGVNPLFDDLFVGRGIFLCQQVSTAGDTAKARRFWAGLWGGALKAFGL